MLKKACCDFCCFWLRLVSQTTTVFLSLVSISRPAAFMQRGRVSPITANPTWADMASGVCTQRVSALKKTLTCFHLGGRWKQAELLHDLSPHFRFHLAASSQSTASDSRPVEPQGGPNGYIYVQKEELSWLCCQPQRSADPSVHTPVPKGFLLKDLAKQRALLLAGLC